VDSAKKLNKTHLALVKSSVAKKDS